MKPEHSPVKMGMSRGRKRVIANREQILNAAREIGVRDGWKAVTIRALGQQLGYASPVLYEHFRNKEDVLTQLAVEGLHELDRKLRKKVTTGPETAIFVLADRYWSYMLRQTQMYRLINGMDGVPVDGYVLGNAARCVCDAAGDAIKQWLAARKCKPLQVEELTDAIWALLHGMASLHLGRAARFNTDQAQRAVLQLLIGALEQKQW